jgi:hypothetical protein
MEDYSIIQGQTILEILFALLSVLIASYVYRSWRARAYGASVAGAKPAVASKKMLCQVILQGKQNSSASSGLGALWKKYESPVGDWLAPILVWCVVLSITLAVVGFLLGES